MDHIKLPIITPKRSLKDIAFYRNVVELFTLSRKLKSYLNTPAHSVNQCAKLELILSDFSKTFLQLPLSIAEVEVTNDEIKKVKTHLYIKGAIAYIFQCWSLLNAQDALKVEYKKNLEEKMTSLLNSYKSWSTSLTCSN